MKWHPLWWLVGLAALACGGTTSNHDRETPSGGSGGRASSPGGSGTGERPSAGGSGNGASNQAGSRAMPTPNGGTHAAGGAGGAGGFVQPSGGAVHIEDPNNLDCSQPYQGPMAAARSAGPAPISAGTCEAIPDEALLARYDDFKARVPTGFFYDPATQLEIWDAACSSSVSGALAHSSIEGAPQSMHQTDLFYELVYCLEGTRRLFRSRSCDYFDGSTLSAPSPERLLFLSSLLWWAQNHDNSSSAQLGYNVQVGNATDWVEVCTVSTAFGDFGLCDELTLESTVHLIRADGQVELGEPTPIRTIQGECH